MRIYLGLEYSRCRHPDNKYKSADWTVYDGEVFLCGERTCPVVDGVQYECLNPLSYGVQPNSEELQHIEFGFGLMGYEDISFALFSTFIQIFQTGSFTLIILFKQAMQRTVVELYYYTLIILMYANSNLAPTST